MVGVLLASVVAFLLLTVAFLRINATPGAYRSRGSEPLVLYCAAGVKPAVAEIATRYELETGVRIDIQYGGSGTLLGQIEVNPRGDLYIAADESYLPIGRAKGLLVESIPLATQHPVLAVARGNPKSIAGIRDLLEPGVTFALANPDAAAVGRATREAFQETGDWDRLEAACRVFKPTVNELATDVRVGAVDAAIVWDCTAAQIAEIEAVEIPELRRQSSLISVAVLAATDRPAEALRFARYLAAHDRGGESFDALGYGAVARDRWEPRPRILLYAGSMFNAAIEDAIQRFETREGVEVTRVYNGCGILVSQMRSGGEPDAYFSCDISFMSDVAERFGPPIEVSENQLVIAVQKGNPLAIHALSDLTRNGIRLGLAHPDKSALGHLTERLLRHEGLLEPLTDSGNWKLDAPQGDFLVNQIQAGGLDAAIVYASNAYAARDDLDTVPIPGDLALARQPFAVARETEHPRTTQRLLEACLTARARFERIGFRWLAEESR